jgi:alkanesulfonate monooxygenase SsuD/methylene tetrahydromethanopterin reductase-like flavin-dependent oxidoreductase (luciferase family)
VVAEHADVWNSAVSGLEAAAATGKRLIEACLAIGRDPAEIRWSGQVECDGMDPEATVAELGRWWEAGFSELILYLRGTDPVRAAEVAAEQILPRLRGAASAV